MPGDGQLLRVVNVSRLPKRRWKTTGRRRLEDLSGRHWGCEGRSSLCFPTNSEFARRPSEAAKVKRRRAILRSDFHSRFLSGKEVLYLIQLNRRPLSHARSDCRQFGNKTVTCAASVGRYDI